MQKIFLNKATPPNGFFEAVAFKINLLVSRIIDSEVKISDSDVRAVSQSQLQIINDQWRTTRNPLLLLVNYY